MDSVWILEIGCYSDRYVSAVFSSQEEAHRQLLGRGLVCHREHGDGEETWGPPGNAPDWEDVHSLSMTALDDFWEEEKVAVTLREQSAGGL